MIHYLYVGHFLREGDFIKFVQASDGSSRPAVKDPLDLEAVRTELARHGLTPTSIPENWGLWLDEGFLVCDFFTHSRDAIEFVRQVASATQCDIADMSSLSLVTPEELHFAWDPITPHPVNTNVPA